MNHYIELTDDEEDDEKVVVEPKRIAIAKLIAASLLEQEAALLSPAILSFDARTEGVVARNVIEKVKQHLRRTADKLRQ